MASNLWQRASTQLGHHGVRLQSGTSIKCIPAKLHQKHFLPRSCSQSYGDARDVCSCDANWYSRYFIHLRRRSWGLAVQNVLRCFRMQLGGEPVLPVRYVPDDRVEVLDCHPLCDLFWVVVGSASKCLDTRATGFLILQQGFQNVFACRGEVIQSPNLAIQEDSHILEGHPLQVRPFGLQRLPGTHLVVELASPDQLPRIEAT